MSLGDLLILYVAVGLACAVAVYRAAPEPRGRAVASAAVAVPLWPLWAPIVLTARRAQRTEPAPSEPTTRVLAALREGVEACQGTALEALLPRDAATRIASEVTRARDRVGELDVLLASDGFEPAVAAERVRHLETSGAPPRTLATARLHLDNVRRLVAIRERDRNTLAELADLVAALRTQLVLARYAGAGSLAGASGTVAEVWARVETLGAVLDGGAELDGDYESERPTGHATPVPPSPQ